MLAVGGEQQPAAEVFALLAVGGLAALRIERVDFGKLVALERELVDQIRAAARPPDARGVGRGSQAEPTLKDGFAGERLFFGQVDERQLVGVEAVGGDERAAAIGQRNNVERQVVQLDLVAGRREGPAVGQQEAAVGLAGQARLVVVGQRERREDHESGEQRGGSHGGVRLERSVGEIGRARVAAALTMVTAAQSGVKSALTDPLD